MSIRVFCDSCKSEITDELPRGDNSSIELRLKTKFSEAQLKISISTAYKEGYHICVYCVGTAIKNLDKRPQAGELQ